MRRTNDKRGIWESLGLLEIINLKEKYEGRYKKTDIKVNPYGFNRGISNAY